MKNSKYFCGIFATVFVTTTMALLASCSQDDDYYDNSEMYTLAEEMGTRSGGNGGDPGYVGDGNDIPFLSNECGVWCILYIKKENQKYSSYSALVDSATSPTIGWDREHGQPLYGEQMQALGNMVGINFTGWLSNTNKQGNITNDANNKLKELLEDEHRYKDRKLLNVVISVKTYRDGKMYPHYVVVKGYDNKKKTKVAVYDVNVSKQDGYYSSVSFDDILGIIY